MGPGTEPQEQADAHRSEPEGPRFWLILALAALIVPLLIWGNSLEMVDSLPRLGPAAYSRPPRLLALGADKCVPCKEMAPHLAALQKEYAGRLKVEIVNVWETGDQVDYYGVYMIPTQIFFDAGGKELYRHQGFYSKSEIVEKWHELGYLFDQKKSPDELSGGNKKSQ